jgi:hypothetical protein
MNFIIAHKQDAKKFFEATIDLSIASKKWLRTVMEQRKSQLSFGSILSIGSVGSILSLGRAGALLSKKR